MMTLKRRNQTLEAGAERLKTELESARAETEAVKGQLEAEVASSKARNSSTWRLRQENERLQKAEAAWKEKQAYAAGSDGAKMVGMGSATSDDAISATEVQALHAKVRNTPPLLCVLLILVLLVVSERSNFECVRQVAESKLTIDRLEAANEQRNESITALRTELAQARAAERVVRIIHAVQSSIRTEPSLVHYCNEARLDGNLMEIDGSYLRALARRCRLPPKPSAMQPNYHRRAPSCMLLCNQ
jgi:hypothetical protein